MWIVYASLAAIIWGLDYSLGERVFQYNISPYSLLAVQMLVGAIFFSITASFHYFKHDLDIILSKPNLIWLLIAAVITFNLGNLLIFLSIQAKNATIAGILELCYPIFTILFTWLLFKQTHLSASTIIGSIFIFIGALIVTAF